jgi:tetratricopeptide (TPR) repeat protein
MLRLLLAFTFFINFFAVHAQYDFNQRCISAYESIIDLKFEESKALIDKELEDNPENLIPIFLNNYIDFITLVICEEKAVFEKLKSNKNKRIKALEVGDDESPYYRYCLAGIYLQWAFTRLKFREYLRAVFEVKIAYRLLEANHEKFPEFTPNLIGLGLIHTLAGTIPDQYQWLVRLFIAQGSVQQGLSELQAAAEVFETGEYSCLLPENLFLITFLQLNFRPGTLGSIDFEDHLENMAEDNILISYAYSRILMKTGHNDKAIEVLSSRPKGEQYFPFYYLEYLLGRAKLYRLDTNAKDHFYKYVTNFKGQNFIKDAYQKLAWYYLIQGDTIKYDENKRKILQYGKAVVDADKQAKMEAMNKGRPNVDLLKARLLFDGGYYEKAEQLLVYQNVVLTSVKDSVEYDYRLGRIYHAWGKIDKAIFYYQKTIMKGSSLPNYFAANAALNLGIIYESRGEFEKSKKYYKSCFNLDYDEYKASISQKAKAGLNRLKDK